MHCTWRVRRLSSKSREILGQLAASHSIEQTLASNLELRYGDVAEAARQALALEVMAPPDRLEHIRRRFPRAYEPWTEREVDRLVEMNNAGTSIEKIAAMRVASQARFVRG